MLVAPSFWPRVNSFRRTESDLTVDVRLWHGRDLPAASANFRNLGQCGPDADDAFLVYAEGQP
jgi:hypothetical protein